MEKWGIDLQSYPWPESFQLDLLLSYLFFVYESSFIVLIWLYKYYMLNM